MNWCFEKGGKKECFIYKEIKKINPRKKEKKKERKKERCDLFSEEIRKHGWLRFMAYQSL